MATVSDSDQVMVAVESASALTVLSVHFEKMVFSTVAAPPPAPKFFS